jgi:hypothetical protein
LYCTSKLLTASKVSLSLCQFDGPGKFTVLDISKPDSHFNITSNLSIRENMRAMNVLAVLEWDEEALTSLFHFKSGIQSTRRVGRKHYSAVK